MNPKTKTQSPPVKLETSPATGIPEATARLPRPEGHSNRRKAWMLGGAVAAVALVGVLLWRSGLVWAHQPYTGPTWVVKREKLKLTIVARGNLEALKNSDVYCTVRSGTKGSTSSTIIKWIIDEGTPVKKGDKLMELDSSGFQDQLKDRTTLVDNAYAARVTAIENVRIQESQNTSDIEAAKNVLALAEIDLKKYLEGDFLFSLKDVDGRIEMAKSDLEDWKDRAAWSARMVKKGLMSKVQADADKSRSEASRITLEKIQEEKRVLVDYMKKRTIRDLTAKVEEAKRALERVQIQAKAKLAQVQAARKTAESVYQQEEARKQEIEAEIAKCTVRSPQDGMVVYYVPEQVRGGGGSQQSVVAQGEPVREGQKMIQIPDLSKMIVTVRVPEAFVAHLHSGDKHNRESWQKAQIRVDSFSKHTLDGHVRAVDTVASQMDWFASDVKVYKTKVEIHNSLPGLRPGMSAEVTIFADETPEPVLVVPVQSVVGSISTGAERKCFVLDSRGQPEERTITVGMSNERLVEVQSGLKEGEQVVLNPQALVKDPELKAGKPRTQSQTGHGEQRGEGSPGAGGQGPGGKGPGGKGPAGKAGPKGAGKGGPGGPGGPASKQYGGGAPGAP